ncbi:GNAT family N-acetyltransferase [Macrococcus capreoli]|uniref:GNAT family N-acetyltransferase n=1 Tax=Macrococcus capreoli TaxID=2982690 RepID=UPI0021D60822|nr:GNAT family N-acetyltransferase [Macrococcus sp. TMW 2.2395]MCU7558483.1 GNAT family N-acetyltransferase [Macrococcus sp. TMW 2.2395]
MITYEMLSKDDAHLLKDFFTLVLTHTFNNNGIDDDEDLQVEIDKKMTYVTSYFKYNKDIFMVAKDGDALVGIIGFYQPNIIIQKLLGEKVANIKEMGSLYVHPDYQNQGVGSTLIKRMTHYIKQQGIYRYCFDCGYQKSIQTWTRKLGEPTYFFKDHWGNGGHHAVWIVDLKRDDL